MNTYNTPTVIPDRGPEAAGEATTPAKPEKPEPDLTTVATGSPPLSPTPPAEPPHHPVPRGWIITDAGLESRITAGPTARLVEYVIDKAWLLRTRDGEPGVSDAALHVAGKSWLADPYDLVDAIAAALRTHFPEQSVIDVVATREAVMREWSRTHRPREEQELGWDYQPGEATTRALHERRAEAAAGPLEPAWLSLYAADHHGVLREHGGLDPASAANADVFNRFLIAAARRGIAAADLQRLAASAHLHLIEGEELEEDLFDGFDWYVECLTEMLPLKP